MTEPFIGDWTIARTILDYGPMTEIVCVGSARLHRERERLAYDEAVSFSMGGKRIAATRAYRFASAGDAIVATFSDGAPFFTLRINADGIGSASHQCGDDRYELTLTLRPPNVWQTVWRVSGTKRLRIATSYEQRAILAARALPDETNLFGADVRVNTASVRLHA